MYGEISPIPLLPSSSSQHLLLLHSHQAGVVEYWLMSVDVCSVGISEGRDDLVTHMSISKSTGILYRVDLREGFDAYVRAE